MPSRAAAINVCLLFSFASSCCPLAKAQAGRLPVPPVDVQISLSQAAEARSGSEKITITVNYFGFAARGVKSADGRVDVGGGALKVSAKSQNVHMPGPFGDMSRLATVRGPLRLLIAARSENLSCDTFEGPVKDVVQDPPLLHCSLLGEKTENVAGMVVIPKSQIAQSCAIYSLLLPGAPTDKIAPSNIQRWFLLNQTVNRQEMNPAVPPDGELKPPPDNASGFNEALQDFRFRQWERVQIDRTCFQSNSSVTLIDQRRVSQLRYRPTNGIGITFFSAVYFNNNQTAALVYVNDWCANFCAAGQWVYLEKQNGQWVRRSGIVTGGL